MQAQKIIQIHGKGIVIRGNDMDTDRIIPARFLKEITFVNMGNYSFYDERFDEFGKKKNHPFNEEKYKGASILVVNNNFGCGSSREHAPQSLMRFGINAIIGESFADIFAGNCSMIGLPTASIEKDAIENLMEFIEQNPDKNIELDLRNKQLIYNDIKLNVRMRDSMRNSFLEGTWDSASMMLEAKDEIKKTMARLPYLNDFK